jgi:hypothetical protein
LPFSIHSSSLELLLSEDEDDEEDDEEDFDLCVPFFFIFPAVLPFGGSKAMLLDLPAPGSAAGGVACLADALLEGAAALPELSGS